MTVILPCYLKQFKHYDGDFTIELITVTVILPCHFKHTMEQVRKSNSLFSFSGSNELQHILWCLKCSAWIRCHLFILHSWQMNISLIASAFFYFFCCVWTNPRSAFCLIWVDNWYFFFNVVFCLPFKWAVKKYVLKSAALEKYKMFHPNDLTQPQRPTKQNLKTQNLSRADLWAFFVCFLII